MSRATCSTETQRVCSQCHEPKADSEFGPGDPYRCLGCIRARIATWRLRKRQERERAAASAPVVPARAARPAPALRPARAAASSGAGVTLRARIAEIEERARASRLRARDLEPERVEAARALARLTGAQRRAAGEAEALERELDSLERHLADAEAGTPEREYVLTADLAVILGPEVERRGIVSAAERAGVDRRALRGIIDCERPLTTLRLADQLCTRLDLDLSALQVVTRDAVALAS